jgi:DNA-directed RNA polymerase specialized sigma24 family protein
MSETENNRLDRFDKENEVKLAQVAEWVQRACQGDQVAFDKLYENNIGFIYNYFLSRVGSISDAEKLTDKTLTEATGALVQGHYNLRDKPFKLWLYSIATDVLLEQHPEPSNTLPKGEQNRLWQLIREFSFAEQQVLAMRHLDHLSFVEITILLGRSEKDCRRLYYQAFVKLKKMAQKQGHWDEIIKGK